MAVDLKTTIQHNAICDVAAATLGKEYTADKVDKVVTTYAESMYSLIEEHKPTKSGESIFVSTPLIGFKITGEEDGRIKKNADGTSYSISGENSISTAIPKRLNELVNASVSIIEKVVTGSKEKAALGSVA